MCVYVYVSVYLYIDVYTRQHDAICVGMGLAKFVDKLEPYYDAQSAPISSCPCKCGFLCGCGADRMRVVLTCSRVRPAQHRPRHDNVLRPRDHVYYGHGSWRWFSISVGVSVEGQAINYLYW